MNNQKDDCSGSSAWQIDCSIPSFVYGLVV